MAARQAFGIALEQGEQHGSHDGRDVLRRATGRPDVEDALGWIAEGHPLKGGMSKHTLLRAIIELNTVSEVRRNALRRLARLVTESQLDTGSLLFNPELLAPLAHYKEVLDLLARKSPSKNFAGLTAEALAAAQRENPMTMEVFAAIGGLSLTDLKARLGDCIPNRFSARWPAKSVSAVFDVVHGIICGAAATRANYGAIAMRPVELLLDGAARGAWGEIDKLRSSGVPYEFLLAQRTVGSAWGAHRNRTSSKFLLLLATSLCERLDALRVRYRRGTTIGGPIRPGEIHRLTGAGSHIALGAVDRKSDPFLGVAFSIARDGGTARKNGGRLLAAVKSAQIPIALIVGGAGWSVRNETAELAAAFAGQIYSDTTIDELAQTISRRAKL